MNKEYSCAITGKEITDCASSSVSIGKREVGNRDRKGGNDGKAMGGNCGGDKIEAVMDGNEIQEIDLDAKADAEQVTGNQGCEREKDCGELLMIKDLRAGYVNDVPRISGTDDCESTANEFEKYCLAGNYFSENFLGQECLNNEQHRIVSTHDGMLFQKDAFSTQLCCARDNSAVVFPKSTFIVNRITSEEMTDCYLGASSESQDDNEVALFMRSSNEHNAGSQIFNATNEKYIDTKEVYQDSVRQCDWGNEYYEPLDMHSDVLTNNYGSQRYYTPREEMAENISEDDIDHPVTSVYFQSSLSSLLSVHVLILCFVTDYFIYLLKFFTDFLLVW